MRVSIWGVLTFWGGAGAGLCGKGPELAGYTVGGVDGAHGCHRGLPPLVADLGARLLALLVPLVATLPVAPQGTKAA